jgi:hypothetical protein
METILRYIQVRSFGRGMRGYNTAWFVVGAALWMVLRARRNEDVVFRTKLKPGERLVINAGPSRSTSDPGS